MKFTNLKISCECIFPIENIAHVRSLKTFCHISAHFRNPGFHSVSKPRKPVFTPKPLRPMVGGRAEGKSLSGLYLRNRVGSSYLVGTLVRGCRCATSWCATSWSDLDLTLDLAVVPLTYKILSGLSRQP